MVNGQVFSCQDVDDSLMEGSPPRGRAATPEAHTMTSSCDAWLA